MIQGPGRLGFRYARSADGTSIAWARLGSGPALVMVPPVPFSGDRAVPLLRAAYERLARTCELILYDGRGTGASERFVTDLSIERTRQTSRRCSTTPDSNAPPCWPCTSPALRRR